MSGTNGLRDAAALQDEIQQTRAELGRTVQQLAARVDVPARVRASATHTAEQVRAAAHRPVPWLVLAAAAVSVAGLVAAGIYWGRRR